jgi:hypothetical protein
MPTRQKRSDSPVMTDDELTRRMNRLWMDTRPEALDIEVFGDLPEYDCHEWTVDTIKPQPWWRRLYRYLFYPKYTQKMLPTVIVPHD